MPQIGLIFYVGDVLNCQCNLIQPQLTGGDFPNENNS